MSASGAAGALLAAELCAPLLLLCGLCCWPLDASDTSSNTGKHPQKPIVTRGSRRRSSDLVPRRAGSSAVSLHMPSTSGNSRLVVAAHRSHEELPRRSRRPSPPSLPAPLSPGDADTRYHSAPSVIDEVLHRRDWERSTKELYIPLRPETALSEPDSETSSPSAPRAEPESSSVECLKSTDRLAAPCKKHHSNIKSSRNRTKKESNQSDVKDTDATEDDSMSNFYIGEMRTEDSVLSRESSPSNVPEEKIKSVYKAKDAKQTFNESIKTKKRPDFVFKTIDDQENLTLDMYHVQMLDIDMDLYVDELDRDGAIHHSGSRSSLATCMSRTGPFPPSSVETVGYEGGACYLAESGVLSRPALSSLAAVPGGRVAELASVGRARHASDGDILAPTLRPESGAFSESDLELELAGREERPPPYSRRELRAGHETAI